MASRSTSATWNGTATTLVSKTTGGVPGNGDSDEPAISRDGRFLGFESLSTNFPGGLGGTDSQVYVRNRSRDNAHPGEQEHRRLPR